VFGGIDLALSASFCRLERSQLLDEQLPAAKRLQETLAPQAM
jgi:hypothetical protein